MENHAAAASFSQISAQLASRTRDERANCINSGFRDFMDSVRRAYFTRVHGTGTNSWGGVSCRVTTFSGLFRLLVFRPVVPFSVQIKDAITHKETQIIGPLFGSRKLAFRSNLRTQTTLKTVPTFLSYVLKQFRALKSLALG